MKESEIRAQVRDLLRWKGWFVYYLLQGLGCYPGLSDMVAVKVGRVIHIELKTKRGKQSDNQIQFQADIEAAGGEYRVVRCIEDVSDL